MSSHMIIPICYWCKHFNVEEHEKNPAIVHTCAAFPKGIPHKIISSSHDHRYSFTEDQGIRFEVNTNRDALASLVKRLPVEPYELLELMLYGIEEARRTGKISPPLEPENKPKEPFLELYIRTFSKAQQDKNNG